MGGSGIAFYQADAVAKTYAALGYLVPILTVLCVTIMPRAKFIQTIVLNTISVCIGSVRILRLRPPRAMY